MEGLDVVPIYCSNHRTVLNQLVHRLGAVFRTSVRLHRPRFDPELTFDASRGQYRSTLLLSLLLEEPARAGRKILGITTVDLFTPVLTYVFGEAQLDGRAAVVSMHRLRAEAYGLAPDPALLLTRTAKECIHELGHTFGLLHCLAPSCVMHASAYVEEVDLKTDGFCPQCLTRMRGHRAVQAD